MIPLRATKGYNRISWLSALSVDSSAISSFTRLTLFLRLMSKVKDSFLCLWGWGYIEWTNRKSFVEITLSYDALPQIFLSDARGEKYCVQMVFLIKQINCRMAVKKFFNFNFHNFDGTTYCHKYERGIQFSFFLKCFCKIWKRNHEEPICCGCRETKPPTSACLLPLLFLSTQWHF